MLDNPSYLVDIEQLSVHLSGSTILDKVSLQIKQHTIHAITGPNGAGKTTLVRCLLGHLPHQGNIYFAGKHPADIAYVPQQLNFDRNLPITVADFFHLFLARRPVFFGRNKTLNQKILRLLDQSECGHLLNRPLAELSGGECRRVMIAQALSSQPRLLVMDEPESNMDEQSASNLEKLLCLLRSHFKITIVLVAHDWAMVERIADQLTLLNKTVIFTGNMTQFKQQYAHSLSPPLTPWASHQTTFTSTP